MILFFIRRTQEYLQIGTFFNLLNVETKDYFIKNKDVGDLIILIKRM
jgi:hypothetical protein